MEHPDKINSLVDFLKHYNIQDEHTKEEVSEAIRDGEVVALNFEGHLYALVCDARNSKAVEQLYTIKNRPKHKTMSALANLELINELVDLDEVPDVRPIKHLFTKEGIKNLIDIFSKNGFINIPVKKEHVQKIPESLRSKDKHLDTLQVISVEKSVQEEHTHASHIQQKILDKLKAKHKDHGILAITSMNLSGVEDSITDKERAIEFCQNRNVSIIVHYDIKNPKGSYSINHIRKDSFITGVRTGKGLEKINIRLQEFLQEFNEFKMYNK